MCSLFTLLAAVVAPPGTYHRLKLVLLLSLVASTQSRDQWDVEGRTQLDLLAVGSDTHLLTRLLSYSSSLAKRSVTHGAVSDLSGFVRKDSSGGCYVDGEKAFR